MFAVESTVYEQLLVEAVGINTVCSSLELALKTGTPNIEPTSSHRPLNAALQRASTTNMRYLKVCKEMAATFRRECRASLGDPSTTHLVDTAQEQARRECVELAATLIAEPYPPHHKADVALDGVRRVLCLQERHRPSPRHADWDVALELLIVRGCAVSFVFGQWSLEAAHAELDLALVYVRLANHATGYQHAQSGLSILRQIEERTSTKEHLRHKFEFALATCSILKGDFPIATQQAGRAQSTSNDLQSEEERHWSNLLYLLALAGEKGAHNTLLDACDLVLAGEGSGRGDPLWAYLPILNIHMHLLQRSDEELRSPCVAASKKRLVEAVKGASTKAQLQAVDAMINQDAALLQERSKALTHTLIRQAEQVVHLGKLWTERVLDHNIESSTPLVGVIALIVCRAASAVGRDSDAKLFGGLARKALTAQLGYGHPLYIQASIDSTVPPELYQGVSGIASVRAVIGDLLSVPLKEGVARQLSVSLASNEEADESDLDEIPAAAASILEGTLASIYAQDVPSCRSLGPIIACTSALQSHYATLRNSMEVKMIALWADALADLVGPHHPHTLQKLQEYVDKRQHTPAPKFTPGWGVRTLLSTVTLTCEAPAAYIYVSFDGDVPVEEEGVNSSIPYDGPILLDRLGRITMKAVAVLDGRRSAVSETHFTVVKK